jgi:capsular exopolysaccharide synthesis family protein
MTRVSDALARAAAERAGGEPPAREEQPALPQTDVGIDAWPIEEAGGQEGLLAEPVFEPRVDLMENLPASQLATTNGGLSDKLVTANSPRPGPVEQYRRLAARLHLSQAERGTRTVMVTSALVGEGKTLTATNLALTLSESYKRRVLLIDADLRRPWVHQLLNVPNITGLNDGIRSGVDRKVPLITVSEYLSVLTAGRPDPDPMSVLSSDRMRRVLADAGRSFDWVIVDTPPVALLSDAHLLATLVDTVVMVIRAGTTPLRAMQQAVEAVGRDRVLGVVLNCADDAAQTAEYLYYAYESKPEQTAVLSRG